MRGIVLRLVALAAITLVGCSSIGLGPWGGPAYDLDVNKIGTGEPAISLRNDGEFWNGQPMDCRTRR